MTPSRMERGGTDRRNGFAGARSRHWFLEPFLLGRTLLLASTGLLSGCLSGWVLISKVGDVLQVSTWLPGLFYGFCLALLFGAGATRLRLQRRPHPAGHRALSLALFVGGSTLSYSVAYHVTWQVTTRLVNHLPDEAGAYAIGGIIGGLPGAFGLALSLGLLTPSLDRPEARIAFASVGAILGAVLAVPILVESAHSDSQVGWIVFFAAWQGGMAVMLSVLDGRENEMKRPIGDGP